jgi:hypothetical protein
MKEQQAIEERLERAWAGVRARLEGWVAIGHADGVQAKKVIETLFVPELSNEERFARLGRVEPDVVRLAGLPFLIEVRAAHAIQKQ